MTYLIDTQILIWFQLDSVRLKPSTKSLLIDSKNSIFVSQVSLYEIAIKQKIGKLSEYDKTINELIEIIEKDGFEILSIDNSHISSYDSVPLIEDHRDPFDRLIIATALSENPPIISADEKFENYTDLITLIKA